MADLGFGLLEDVKEWCFESQAEEGHSEEDDGDEVAHKLRGRCGKE